MSIEENKIIIRSLFKNIELGNIDNISALIDKDVRWWVQGKGVLNKTEFCDNSTQIFSMTKNRSAVIDRIVAEGNFVHVNVSAAFIFNDDRVLNNCISLSAEIKNGLIIDSIEYMDVDSVREFFGQ